MKQGPRPPIIIIWNTSGSNRIVLTHTNGPRSPPIRVPILFTKAINFNLNISSINNRFTQRVTRMVKFATMAVARSPNWICRQHLCVEFNRRNVKSPANRNWTRDIRGVRWKFGTVGSGLHTYNNENNIKQRRDCSVGTIDVQ